VPLYTIKGAMRDTGDDYVITSEFPSEAGAGKWAAGIGVLVSDIQLAPPGAMSTATSLKTDLAYAGTEDELLRTQRQILGYTRQICYWVKLWSVLAVILIILEIIRDIFAALASARFG